MWRIIAVVVLALGLAGCNTPQMGQRESIGTGVGALAGGIIGASIGGNAGQRIVGGLVGAAIGGFIGNRIGAYLDEQDRRNMASITNAAFASGGTRSFSNRRTGVRGTARVVNTSTQGGQTCRTVQQEVVLRDGSVQRDTVNGCRVAGGRWVV